MDALPVLAAASTALAAAAAPPADSPENQPQPLHQPIDQASILQIHPASVGIPAFDADARIPRSESGTSSSTRSCLKPAAGSSTAKAACTRRVRFAESALSADQSHRSCFDASAAPTKITPHGRDGTATHRLQYPGLRPITPQRSKSAESGTEDLPGWTTVHRRLRRRFNSPATSLKPTTEHSRFRHLDNKNLKVSLRGKCFRCLARGHYAIDCRDPLKCFNCGGPGHRAWQCPKKISAAASTPSAFPPPPCFDNVNFPPLRQVNMVKPGNPMERPQETFAVAASSRDMDSELARLSTHAAWAWLGGVRPATSTNTVRRAFCSRFRMREEDIKVVRHYPEDFLVTFEHQHHRDTAVAQRDFTYNNIDIRVRPWQLPVHGDHNVFGSHVRLCLEGIPLHAWNDGIAKRAVAKSCVLDYVEAQSLRMEDATTLNLWAWARNPSDIPKVTWLTIVDRNNTAHDATPAGRSGLTFRVIVHLDMVEDPPTRDGHGHPRAYDWRLGVVDGECEPRDRHDPPPPRSNRRRDEDGDSDRRGRRPGRDDSWSSRLFRSISRAPRDRERERSGSRHGQRHDSSGRRHHLDGDQQLRHHLHGDQQPRHAGGASLVTPHVGRDPAIGRDPARRGRSRVRRSTRVAVRRGRSATPPTASCSPQISTKRLQSRHPQLTRWWQRRFSAPCCEGCSSP
jgi:hypothetical protein